MRLTFKNIALLFYLFTNVCVFAQQEALYQHNYINPFIYNPGYVGLSNLTDITLIRNQKWADFNGGLTANFLAVSTPLKNSNSSLGVKLNHDNLGITSKIKANLTYGYRINLADNMVLQPGIAFGVVDQRIDLNDIIVAENDPIFANGYANKKTGIDASFGIFYLFKQFYFGATVPQLLGNKLLFSESDQISYQLERQFIFNTGYKFKLNEKLNIQPDILAIHSPGLPFHYSTSIKAEMPKFGWIGMTYKSDYAIGTNIGFNLIKNLKIGLAYDLKLSKIANLSNSNNFEIALMYSIGDRHSNTIPKTNAILDSLIIDDLVKELGVKDSISNHTIDSLNIEIDSLSNEISIKEMENKVLSDENKLLKENPEIIIVEKPVETIDTTTATTATPQDSISSPTETLTEVLKDVTIENHIKIEQEENDDPSANGSSIQTQSIKVKDDFFVELLDNQASPNGYYVVTGSYSTQAKAEELSKIALKKFPETRIIVNQRNDQYYLVLFYSPDINGVIEALMTSNSIKHKDFTKAWALNYFKKH